MALTIAVTPISGIISGSRTVQYSIYAESPPKPFLILIGRCCYSFVLLVAPPPWFNKPDSTKFVFIFFEFEETRFRFVCGGRDGMKTVMMVNNRCWWQPVGNGEGEKKKKRGEREREVVWGGGGGSDGLGCGL